MSRGKKRMGYELDIKINFTGYRKKFKGSEVEIKLIELCDDGGEPEVELNVSGKQEKDQVNKL